MATPGVPAWGCPWHGLIEDETLALPNGQTMHYRRPSQGFQQSGNTLLQRMPWAVDPVPVSPEQAAYDAEHGRQWKPWAILAGADMQLHGQNLGGWIYADPSGHPWLVGGSALFASLDNPALLEGDIRFTRFGVLGGKFERIELPISVPSGQGAPTLSLVGSINPELMDIVPDGSKAILMLNTRSIGQVITTLMPLGLFPLGFLLVEIAGTPGDDLSVSVSVLRTRAQTLGTGVDTGYPSVVTENAYVLNPGSAAFVKETVEVVGGVYPACTGYRDVIGTYNPITTNMGAPPAGTPSGSTKRVYVEDTERTSSITGRVLAMWFDEAHVPQPLTLDMTTLMTATFPVFDFTTSGKNVVRNPFSPGPGECVLGAASNVEQSLTFHLGRTVQYRVTSRLVLKWGDREVETTATYAKDSVYTCDDYVFKRIDSWAWVTPAGTDTGSVTSTLAEDTWWTAQTTYLPPGQPLDVSDSARYRLQNVQIAPSSTQNWWLGVSRYSNNLVGLFGAYLDPGNSYPLGRFLGTVSPGATTTTETPLYNNTELTARLKGSYHPVTHAVDRNKGYPTCWV